MIEHHHNMRNEELPQQPEVVRAHVDPDENRHGDAITLRFGALIASIPAMVFALATLGNFDAAGGLNAIVPVLFLGVSAVLFRRARELDPDDRW